MFGPNPFGTAYFAQARTQTSTIVRLFKGTTKFLAGFFRTTRRLA